jgi:hypothetical protein
MTDEFETRPPGRPRKWDTNAERSRAYRRRRAEHLAQPMLLVARAAQLARELRAVRAELDRGRREGADLRRSLRQLEAKYKGVVEQSRRALDELWGLRQELAHERSRYRQIGYMPSIDEAHAFDDGLTGARIWPDGDQ